VADWEDVAMFGTARKLTFRFTAYFDKSSVDKGAEVLETRYRQQRIKGLAGGRKNLFVS
jgi:hypothetical protein